MRSSNPFKLIIFGAVLLVLVLWGAITAADWVIEYNWWKEVGQVSTWVVLLWYSIGPVVVGAAVAFVALSIAHARGLHFAGIRKRDFQLYSRLAHVGVAILAVLFASAAVDYWTVMRFVGSRGITVPPDAWTDQVFSRRLPFYLFDLPFYSGALAFVFVLAIICALVFWITARAWQLWARGGSVQTIENLGPDTLLLRGATRSSFVRLVGVILLLCLAIWVFLGNYDLVFNSHAFMTGADYVDEKIVLPLRWLLIVTILGGMPLAWTSRYKLMAILIVRRSSCSCFCRQSFVLFTCDPMRSRSSGPISSAIFRLLLLRLV